MAADGGRQRLVRYCAAANSTRHCRGSTQRRRQALAATPKLSGAAAAATQRPEAYSLTLYYSLMREF